MSGPSVTWPGHGGRFRLGCVLGLQNAHEDEVLPAVWVQYGLATDPLLAETTGQVAVDGAGVAGQHLQLDTVRTQLTKRPGHNQPAYLLAQAAEPRDGSRCRQIYIEF